MTGFDAISPRLVGWQPAEPNDPEQPSAKAGDFRATLSRAVREVAELQQDAHDKAMALARGEPVQVHDVLIAMGKSEIAFNLALEVRNRLLQAWETLARTAV